MTIYICADLHFGHRNMAKFCPETRGRWDTRNNPEQMNEDMIIMWNDIVQSDDLTYILGDVAFCSGSEAARILNRLNGEKILLVGNHDKKNLKDPSFRAAFKEIHDYLEIEHNGVKAILGHYPFLEWNGMHRGSVNFFGHLHNNKSGLEEYRSRNVGFDYTGKIVWNLDDAIADALEGKVKEHH